MASINATTSSGIVATADNTGQLQLQSAGTTVMTITSTGETVTGTGSFSGNLSFNSGYGSSAVAYGCRAWVNFNGTGTPAILASGNVSSITDNGTGDYTVNFTTAMPDTNYSVAANAAAVGSVNFQTPIKAISSVSAFAIYTSNGTTLTDSGVVCAAVFR